MLNGGIILKMNILGGIFATIMLIGALIVGTVTSFFESVFDSSIDIFTPDKPLVIEKKDFTLTLEKHPGQMGRDSRGAISNPDDSTSLYAPFKEDHASFFACGDGDPVLYVIGSESYENRFDPSDNSRNSYAYNTILYSDNFEKVKIGNNEFLKNGEHDYYLMMPSVILNIMFYPESCQGKYSLSDAEKNEILSGIKLEIKNKKETTAFIAHENFIRRKLSGEITTPSQCFALSDLSSVDEQNICKEFTEFIYNKVIADVSGAFYNSQGGKVYDEESCRLFLRGYGPAEKDVMISEFDHKGTLSVCASVESWKK